MNPQHKVQHNHCFDCHSEKSRVLWAGGREARKPSLCILEGAVLRGVTVRWRKMTLHLWWQRERRKADSYPNSFPCRSAAQNQSRRQCVWCTGRTVTPAKRVPRKETVKEKRHFTLKWCLTASEGQVTQHAGTQFFFSLITKKYLHWFGISIVAAVGVELSFDLNKFRW